MAGISLDGVSKVYPGGVEAVRDISLDIADGELCVLVGPSGCGKSTLLRMVAGLETITRGEITIGDRVVNKLEPAERDIAMVFQNYALYPHMSVFANMAYGLKNRGTPKPEIEKRVAEAAEILGIGDLLDRKPRQLSGGQRQRVAMGRAIVRHPQVFLFDEPLSNLDAKLRVQTRVQIKALQRRVATTSIYVTHDQVEAMTLADQLVVMNAGVAEQIAAPLDVYEHPASVFVAGFIGSPAMNFSDGRIADDGRSVMLDGGATLRGSPALADNAGRPVVVGVRPEHVALVAEGEADLVITVTAVETLGADTLAHGSLAANGSGEDTDFAARLPGTATIREGERLPLKAADGALHLFDKETGRRIADI